MINDFVGKKSEQVKNVIEKGAVRKFAKAIGETHPLFTDEEYAKQTKYGKPITPVTYPVTLDYGVIEGLQLPSAGLIHGEQSFHYYRPLYIGEEIYCSTELKDYTEKEAKSGKLGILTFVNYGEDSAGEVIFQLERVIILTETVRKELVK